MLSAQRLVLKLFYDLILLFNIIQLVDEGINNPEVATNAIAEILEQLYQSDKYKTMVAIDNYNNWFQPSRFPSFRYENDKNL